jgi:hypothetical protein
MSIAVRLPELLLKYNNGSKMEQCPIVEVILAHLRTLLGTSAKQQLDKSMLSSQPQRRLTSTGEVVNVGQTTTTGSIISDYGASQVGTGGDKEVVKPSVTVTDLKGRPLSPLNDRYGNGRRSKLIQTSV